MINILIKKKQLIKDATANNLTEPYFRKARSNLVTMEILNKAEKYKDTLAIPKDHSTDEWVVVVAYYAMYMAALSILAKMGFRSKSHSATAIALEEFFVKKKLLDKNQLENFETAKIRKEEIELLREVKDRREIAQYSVTKKTTKELAEDTKNTARKFVDDIERILEKMQQKRMY